MSAKEIINKKIAELYQKQNRMVERMKAILQSLVMDNPPAHLILNVRETIRQQYEPHINEAQSEINILQKVLDEIEAEQEKP